MNSQDSKPDPILESPWQRAKSLTPTLNPALTVYRQSYRSEQWYVLRRKGSDRLYRTTRERWHILGLCDGQRSLDSIFHIVAQKQPSLSESDFLATIYQSFQSGLIHLHDAGGLITPPQSGKEPTLLDKFKNPFFIRFPLWDPDRFLTRHSSKVAPFFTLPMLFVWIIILCIALFNTAFHWEAITDNIVDRVFNPQSLLLLWCIYPVTKLIHELGHAFAVKARGGDVHEIGIVFMYGIPLPYVNATDSLTFKSNRARLLVDGIGVMVELFMASIALFAWLNVSTGLVSQIAYNTMIICSVSTVFFNGNPLMRFDGYYFLSDLLGIPNLATRSNSYWQYLFKRYLLSLPIRFSNSRNEKKWLIIYAPLSLLYRLFVLIVITLAVSQFFLPLGILLGLWFLFTQVVKPLTNAALYLLSTERTGQKTRAIQITVTSIAALILILGIIPFPVNRTLPAVVWLPENAEVRAGTEGVIQRVLAEEGKRVSSGQHLFQLEDPYLTLKRDLARHRLEEVSTRLNAVQMLDPVEAQLLREELAFAQSELATLQQENEQLEVTSSATGHFYLPPEVDASGSFVSKGAILAYILDRNTIVLRGLISQDDVDVIRSRSQSARVKLINWPGETYSGSITRLLPTASTELPSAVLGTAYGGDASVDPTNPEGNLALEEWFQFEVTINSSELPQNVALWVGSRAWVRFESGKETLFTQAYWKISQLFMEKLNI